MLPIKTVNKCYLWQAARVAPQPCKLGDKISFTPSCTPIFPLRFLTFPLLESFPKFPPASLLSISLRGGQPQMGRPVYNSWVELWSPPSSLHSWSGVSSEMLDELSKDVQ